MDNLTAVLMNLDSTSLNLGGTPTTEKADEEAPTDTAAPAEEVKAEQPPEEDDDALVIEPYIDTPMCTTCNECIEKNKQMFKYNSDKMAYIADPKAGTFRQLVEAAEACPVSIIHPGTPLNKDEEGLAELIERAKEFN